MRMEVGMLMQNPLYCYSSTGFYVVIRVTRDPSLKHQRCKTFILNHQATLNVDICYCRYFVVLLALLFAIIL